MVETTITNELKTQEIKLTKTAKFEDEKYQPEIGAQVFITDDGGNQYDFKDNGEKYISTIEFQAVPDRKYQLHIKTADGRSFESSPETLTTVNPIQELNASVETQDDQRGVAIKVVSYDPNRKSNYYRYEYEETYKIIAPKWTSASMTLDKNNVLVPGVNSPDLRVCYGDKKSTDILLTNTNDQNEDRTNYTVRFISNKNYIITTRYSIFVKQYIESLGAYTYYRSLKEMSGTQSITSPKQPGILLGNIRAVDNSKSKVLGYFDVASVSSDRLYFNYEDLFPNEAPPPYVEDCTPFCYTDVISSGNPCTHVLFNDYKGDLERGRIIFFMPALSNYWVYTACGDCTSFSSNIKPPFWID
ncbi:hypothetical protein J2X17_000191 [Flavobacterium aquidurense]|nr:hypothetical protein [Flavobacterium aquidurense]